MFTLVQEIIRTLRGSYTKSVTENQDGNVLERLEYIGNRTIGAGPLAPGGAITVSNMNMDAGAGANPPLVRSQTITNPGTSLTTVFDVTGKGYILYLVLEKPSTVNSVMIHYELQIDGTLWVNDQNLHGVTTSAQHGQMVGQRTKASDTPGPILFIPFNTGARLRVRYSGTPGGSENIIARYLVVND